MLEKLKDCPHTIGLKQSLKAVRQNRVLIAFIAADADEKVILGFRELCSKMNVRIEYAESMKVLGAASGIDIGASVACVLK